MGKEKHSSSYSFLLGNIFPDLSLQMFICIFFVLFCFVLLLWVWASKVKYEGKKGIPEVPAFSLQQKRIEEQRKSVSPIVPSTHTYVTIGMPTC